MRRVSLDQVVLAGDTANLDLLALDEALAMLAREDSEKAEIVRLRFFAGLSHAEIARILGVSTITVKRHWRYARVWLHRQLEHNRTSS